MCHAVRCRICGKATWVGCGDHVEEALAGIPDEYRCAGHGSGHTAGRAHAAAGDEAPRTS
jgi:hypothetical protein